MSLHTYSFWTDARRAMRDAADEAGAAGLVAVMTSERDVITVKGYQVLQGHTMEEVEAEAAALCRPLIDSEVSQ